MIILIILFGCSAYNDAKCKYSLERVESIQEQQRVLSELYRIERLSKKNYDYFSVMLDEEENFEIQRMKRSCNEA